MPLATPQITAALTTLHDAGIDIWADGIDKQSHVALLARNKITGASGAFYGNYLTENEMIQQELLHG